MLAIMHQYTSYTILALSAVWALLGKAYLDSYLAGKPEHTLLFIPLVISIVVILSWRYYVHYIDDNMAQNYDRIISFEKVLFNNSNEVPSYSTLYNLVKSCDGSLESLLKTSHQSCYSQQQAIAKRLIENRLIGSRGQKTFDTVASVIIIILISCSSIIFYLNVLLTVSSTPDKIFYLTAYIGCVSIVLLALWILVQNPNGSVPIQRDPTTEQIIKIIENKPIYSKGDMTFNLLFVSVILIILISAFVVVLL